MKTTIENNVRDILKQYPKMKELKQVKRLVWYYWSRFEGLKNSLTFKQFEGLTTPETITRARRAVLEEQGYVDPNSRKQQRKYHKYYS